MTSPAGRTVEYIGQDTASIVQYYKFLLLIHSFLGRIRIAYGYGYGMENERTNIKIAGIFFFRFVRSFSFGPYAIAYGLHKNER